MISPVLYDALSAHTVQLLNDEELATGRDRFWVNLALTIRIQNCELIMEKSVMNIERNCEDVVNKSSKTFDGWTDQENLPKGWTAATSKKGEVKATLKELNAIFSWNYTEWFGKVKKEEVVSSNGNIQAVDWDCIPDIKTVELDSCDIDEADAIEDATKDPNIGILGTFNYTTKAVDDDDGEESKKIIDDATRALNPTKREKKNNCGLCKDIYTKNENLKKHLETHMKRAEVECSACTKSFNIKDIPSNHVKKHTGNIEPKCPPIGRTSSFWTNCPPFPPF